MSMSKNTVSSDAITEEVRAEYISSLADLKPNSKKPHITVLTMVAEENLTYASTVVAAIEEHVFRVEAQMKVPVLHLIDSILTNVAGPYTSLFMQKIVGIFCLSYKEMYVADRAEMFKLRQKWNAILPQTKLYAIDVQLNLIDKLWPIMATLPRQPKDYFGKVLNADQNVEVSSIISQKVTMELEEVNKRMKEVELEISQLEQKLACNSRQKCSEKQQESEDKKVVSTTKLHANKKDVFSRNTGTIEADGRDKSIFQRNYSPKFGPYKRKATNPYWRKKRSKYQYQGWM